MRDELKDRAISLLKEAYDLGWNDGAKAAAVHLEMCREEQQADKCDGCTYQRKSCTLNECMFSDFPDMPYQFDNMTGSMNL